MKRAAVQWKLLVAFLAISLTATGVWAYRRDKSKPVSAGQAIAEALPKSLASSPTDKEISKWTGRVQQSDSDFRAWQHLGDALMQKGRETMDTAYYNHAEKAYRKTLALDSSNVEATVGMAWVTGGRHEFEDSIEWSKKALALDPRNNAAYGLMGDAAVEMGDYDRAMDHYQKMLDLRPDLSSYSRGAHLLFLTGDTRRAAMLMAQAVHVGAPYAENTSWCVAELAKLMLADSMVMPAEKIVTKELKSSPNSVALLAVMGRIKATQKNYPAAIEFYKKSAAIVPQQDTLVALGDLYHLSGNDIEAEKQFQLVETIHKLNKENGVKGDLQIARFYADHDRNLPEALRLAEEEYKTRRSVYGADTLAWCLYKNGKVAEADKMIREAIRLKTEEARFYYHAGVIFAKMQYRETAKQMLAQALAINNHFDPVDAPNAQKQLHEVGGSATLASNPRNTAHNEESGQQ